MENLKYIKLTKEEAEQKCKEMDNMLCSICYVGITPNISFDYCKKCSYGYYIKENI